MALKTPPIKTLGMAGLVRMAIDIDKDGITHDMEDTPDSITENKAAVKEQPGLQKSLTEVILLKVASLLIKFSGVLLQYAQELAEVRKEAYNLNTSDEDSRKDE